MSKNSKRNRYRRSAKSVSFGVPRKQNLYTKSNQGDSFLPIEDWYEPVLDECEGYRVIEQDPGDGYFHPLSVEDIINRIDQLPDSVFENLDVVQLSRLTRKKKRYPCYGLQWGTSIYLYPVGVDLVEVYSCPPRPQLKRETEMYGGRWSVDQGHKLWVLEWNETTILDFYLNNVLIHEIGHLVDHRNKNYLDRERFADWYAIEFGYRKTQAERKKRLGRNRSPIKRHDKS